MQRQSERILGSREVFASKKSREDNRPTKLPIGKSLGYVLMRKGEFPLPIQLTRGRVGWRESDLDAWLEDRSTVDLGQSSKAAPPSAGNVAA